MTTSALPVRGPAWHRVAATWHGITAAIAIVALVADLIFVIRGIHVQVPPDGLPPTGTRVIRYFSYFTVQSNILVAAGTVPLLLRPGRGGSGSGSGGAGSGGSLSGGSWSGGFWGVIRLAGLFGITVTFVTYAVLLAPITNLTGVARAIDIAFHYVVPLLAITGWLLFGPRPRISDNTVLAAAIWPVAYIGYTMAHGAASRWYPYPFIDVTQLGYLTGLRNGLGMVVLMIGVGALYRYLDPRLPGQVAAGPSS